VYYEVLGPVDGAYGSKIYATFVRARGRGASSDPERLEAEVLAVALPRHDITIDLRAVEELGADGIAALVRLSTAVAGWDTGRLFLLAAPDQTVWSELQSSELIDIGRHPRVYVEGVGRDRE